MAKGTKDILTRHKLLIIGIALIIVAAAVIGIANSKLYLLDIKAGGTDLIKVRCDSLAGQIVQSLHANSAALCSYAKTALYLGFVPLALGLVFVVLDFMKKK